MVDEGADETGADHDHPPRSPTERLAQRQAVVEGAGLEESVQDGLPR